MMVITKIYPQLTDEYKEGSRGDREPAPGELSLVHDFVRTNSWLDDPNNLLEWLRAQGLVAAEERVTVDELSPLIDLRRALRALLIAQHDKQAANGEAISLINGVSSAVPLEVRFSGDGRPRLAAQTGDPVDRVTGQMLSIVYDAVADGTWQRLKICRAGDCQWAFYDRSRNRSGAWCDMSDCGNRAKGRAFRKRRSRGE
jgi:predicted RNA-binding Zn ribbon-like protein